MTEPAVDPHIMTRFEYAGENWNIHIRFTPKIGKWWADPRKLGEPAPDTIAQVLLLHETHVECIAAAIRWVVNERDRKAMEERR